MKSVTRRCTSRTGYFDEYVPALFAVVVVSPAAAVTQSVRLEMVGTIDTLMSPLLLTRGVTSSEMPQLKNASLANMSFSSPGISAMFMLRSRESELPPVVRLAEIWTLGYFSVMSTMAFLPFETMIFGLEKMRASPLVSSALRTSDMSENCNVPEK